MRIIFICLLITACTASWTQNNRDLLYLETGMTQSEVRAVMTYAPTFNEAYKSINGVPTTIWFYRIRPGTHSTNPQKSDSTPLVFENGALSGWGDEFYESVRIIEIRER